MSGIPDPRRMIGRSRAGHMIDQRPCTPAEEKQWFDREADEQIEQAEQRWDYQRY